MSDKKVASEKQPEAQNWSGVIQTQAEKWAPAFRMTILLCISVVAVLVRVFSVNPFVTMISPCRSFVMKVLFTNSIHGSTTVQPNILPEKVFMVFGTGSTLNLGILLEEVSVVPYIQV